MKVNFLKGVTIEEKTGKHCRLIVDLDCYCKNGFEDQIFRSCMSKVLSNSISGTDYEFYTTLVSLKIAKSCYPGFSLGALYGSMEIDKNYAELVYKHVANYYSLALKFYNQEIEEAIKRGLYVKN